MQYWPNLPDSGNEVPGLIFKLEVKEDNSL